MATVRRAMLAAEKQTERNTRRALDALEVCIEVLEVSGTMNEARQAAALSTLALLRHRAIDAQADRPSR